MQKFILVLVFILATISSGFGQQWRSPLSSIAFDNGSFVTHKERLYVLKNKTLYREDGGNRFKLIKTFDFDIYGKIISFNDTLFMHGRTNISSGGIYKYHLETDNISRIDNGAYYNSGEKDFSVFKGELYISGYQYLRKYYGSTQLVKSNGLCKYKNGVIYPLIDSEYIYMQQSYKFYNIDSNYLFISINNNQDNYLKDSNGSSYLCNHIIPYNGNSFINYKDNLDDQLYYGSIIDMCKFDNKLFIIGYKSGYYGLFMADSYYDGLNLYKFPYYEVNPNIIFTYKNNMFISNNSDGGYCYVDVNSNNYHINYLNTDFLIKNNFNLDKGIKDYYIHLDTLFINGKYTKDYYGNTKQGVLYLTSLDSNSTYIKEKLSKQPFYISNNTINFPQNLFGLEYKVYDLCGRLVVQDKVRNINTELSLERGMYVLFIDDKYKKFLIN